MRPATLSQSLSPLYFSFLFALSVLCKFIRVLPQVILVRRGC